MEFVARSAAALLANGQTTQATALSLARLVPGVGLSVRWGELVVRSRDGAIVARVDVEPLSVDIAKVIALESLVERVASGDVSATAKEAALAVIGRQPPVGLARFVLMAAAGATALAVVFGATGIPTLGVIAASAGTGALLRRMASRITVNPLVQPFLAALLAGLIASMVASVALPVSLRLVAACPCMVLVPGPHLLNGAIDLARVRITLGFARIGLAGLIMLAICVGLLAGLAPGPGFPAAEAAGPVPLIVDVAAAGVAVAAYGSFFNMPWRLLPLPILIGMAAHALRWLLISAGASLVLGAFGACCLVGIVVSPIAHSFRLPFGAFAFSAVVSMIPGIFVFQTAADALKLVASTSPDLPAVTSSLAVNAATAATILIAMALGVILPKMLFDFALIRRSRTTCAATA